MFKKKSIALNHDAFSIPENDLLVTDALVGWYAIVMPSPTNQRRKTGVNVLNFHCSF